MAQGKPSSIQEGNLCEIIHDHMNWYHKLIVFFVICEVTSRGAVCVLTFFYPFFYMSYSEVKTQVNYRGNNLWFIFFILKPLEVYV